ncbi:SDR family NAD(P)-dependent oxidoreductase [Rhodococcus opacus]|uniref:SDR family NAD(P)-dependent oxidoreductase n=1 Tax=Rhodococcus opacus TaxID=37919 RepID=UPI002474409C|nr:SDR family NAD(P)-dependent oxidoreductase [Rhodococcus opacus]MDH6291982.1 NAD(P)-dependent dehydrogenase (short-subunit alcohol dehydrogenase family) [Rhodococcus opacus]
MSIRYDDRVVVITGAGGGIGRQYTKDFAQRGAKIVANDLGTSLDGQQPAESPLAELVDSIRAEGGEAVISTDNISTPEGAEAAVKLALDSFGRIDVLINNAGITRNDLLADMSPENFRAVLDVHLFGSFHCTRAAWPVLQKQGYGRVLMTTSQSGLYGMETHANYSAAKAGLVGLAHALSLEGQPHAINVNTICPMATTRMSEDFLTPEMAERMRPSSVSAMAMWLCSDQCTETDQVIEAGMGYFAKVLTVEAPGIIIDPAIAEPEYLRDHFAAITDMTDAANFRSVADFLEKVGGRVFSPAQATT